MMKRFLGFIAVVLSAVVFVAAYKPADEPVDLRPMMSSVKNQGYRNTCNTFAATALMEFLIKQKTKKTIDLSESYAYWLGKNYALDTDLLRSMYTDIDALAGFLAVKAFEFGCMEEKEWPYEKKNWEELKDSRAVDANGKPSPNRFTGIPPNPVRLLPYTFKTVFIEKETIADYILTKKRPVLMNIMWCFDAVNDKTGEIRMPTEEETKKAAGHVVLLVGFDPKTRLFVFRNSWGDTWGNKGYGTIPEDYILNYYEVKIFEPFSQHDKETQDFLVTGMKGVTAELFE